jgi:hypothetical protein
MNDYLHRLASRVGFRTLGQQLALLFALLLTLSVGAYAVYVGLEQADFIEQLERRHADELTTALAAALEPHVARGEPPRSAPTCSSSKATRTSGRPPSPTGRASPSPASA